MLYSAASAKSFQLCLTLWDPIDGSPPGSPVPGILQARTLEWVAISFSNAGKWIVKVKSFSRVRPSVTPWTAAFQARLSMGFSRQDYWSRVPLPSLNAFFYFSQLSVEEFTSLWFQMGAYKLLIFHLIPRPHPTNSGGVSWLWLGGIGRALWQDDSHIPLNLAVLWLASLGIARVSREQ